MSDATASSPGVSGRLRRAIGRWLPTSTAGCAASLTWLFLAFMVAVVWTMFFRGPENVPWRHAIGVGRIALVTLLVFAIPVVLYRALRLWLEGERSLYPEISNAWAAGMDALREHGLDLNDLAFYLVLGSRGVGQERAIMQSGKQPLLIEGVPEGPAPMHWYATADAVYLFCSDASWASALAAKRQRELEEFGDPAIRRPTLPRPPARRQPESGSPAAPAASAPAAVAAPPYSSTAGDARNPPANVPVAAAVPAGAAGAAAGPPGSAAQPPPVAAPSPSSSAPPASPQASSPPAAAAGTAPSGAAPMGTVQLDQFLASPASQSFADSFATPTGGNFAPDPADTAGPPGLEGPAGVKAQSAPAVPPAPASPAGRPGEGSPSNVGQLRGTMQLDNSFVSDGSAGGTDAAGHSGFASAGGGAPVPAAASTHAPAAQPAAPFAAVPPPGQHAAAPVPFPVPSMSPSPATAPPATSSPASAVASLGDESFVDAGYERKAVTMNAKESALRVGRLTYLCQQINRFREPLCPINGVLTLLPFAAIDGGTDDAEALQHAVKGDLTTLHYVLQVRCPVTALVTDMERQSGFRELMRRVGRERVAVQRFGRKYDCRSLATETEMLALGELVCGTFEDWIYALFREDEALTRPGNQQLYHLLCQIRCTLKARLTDLLQGAFAYDAEQGSAEDALLFSGCYFAATGERADQRAFIGGILSKLDEEQEWVEWTTDALRREMRWERLAMVGLIVSVLLASGLIWMMLA